MKMWEWLLFIIAALAGMAILITVATKFFKTPYIPSEISGDKQLAIADILNLVYKCYENNEGRRGSVICYKINLDLDEAILSSDILGGIDSDRIAEYRVESDDLGDSGEIIIRYENEFIYIKKVEHERIST